MRKVIGSNGGGVLWASANDTYNWANRPGARWPCSTLAGRRIRAEFDSNGLCDLSVNGRDADNLDGVEFDAFVSDVAPELLP